MRLGAGHTCVIGCTGVTVRVYSFVIMVFMRLLPDSYSIHTCWPHSQYLEVMRSTTNRTAAAAAQMVRMASVYQPNLLSYKDSYSNSLSAPKLPPAYMKLGESCLAKDPLARPSFEEVIEALEGMMILAANRAEVFSDLYITPSTPQQCQSEDQEMAIQDATLIQVQDVPHDPCPSLSSAAASQPPQPFHSCLRNY